MAFQPIIIGAADAKAGDNLFTGATKINANFVELYANVLESAVIGKSISNLSLNAWRDNRQHKGLFPRWRC